MQAESFDVIVIGVGSMGSATCYNLANRGERVLGLEQFSAPNDRGSHAGQSRIFRRAYFEHMDYVPLLQRAYQLWMDFERVANARMFYKTGILYAGEPGNENIQGVVSAANRYKLQILQYTADQLPDDFPDLKIKIPRTFKAIFEPLVGFVRPEVAIAQYIAQAEKLGASIRQHEEVTGWDHHAGKFTVKTTRGKYITEKLIFTAGPWTAKLLPQLESRLKVTEQHLFWIDVEDKEKFSIGNFPCWFIEDPEMGTFYGFPILPDDFGGPCGFKIAHHAPGDTVVNPDHRIRKDPTPYFGKVKKVLEKYFPEIGGRIIDSKVCLYTYSPDSHFIIDHLPGFDNNLTIACGFSGHGFKFVPVVGEILSSLAIDGKTDYPIDFLRLSRFSGSK